MIYHRRSKCQEKPAQGATKAFTQPRNLSVRAPAGTKVASAAKNVKRGLTALLLVIKMVSWGQLELKSTLCTCGKPFTPFPLAPPKFPRQPP